jgi:hypothetical protein
MPTYRTSVEFSDSADGRRIREEWVSGNRVEPIAATKLTLDDTEEAEKTFIDGYFLGSFAVSVIAIEQILHDQLPANDGGQWSLGDIIDKAAEKDLLDENLKSDLIDVNELRRSKFHYRGKRDPAGMEGHIIQRMDEQEKSPDDIRGEDAKLALNCLYGVEAIAEIDIDPDKLPD